MKDAVEDAVANARLRIAGSSASVAPAGVVRVLGPEDEARATELLARAFSGERGGCGADERAEPERAEPERAFDWALGPRMRARALAEPDGAARSVKEAEMRAQRAAWYDYYLRWVVLAGLRYGLVIGLFLGAPSAALGQPDRPDRDRDGRSELAAVAVVLPPGRGWVADTSSWGARARPHMYAIGLRLGGPPPDEWRPADFPPGTSARMRAIGAAGARARAAARSERGWHLYCLATRREHQRAGCAAALLRVLCDVADADGRECFAEAASPRVRALLGRFGFRSARDATPVMPAAADTPDGGKAEPPPTVVLMRRPAAG
ncbi:hypothetical protein KFE25_014430 [Diacronema lutheri]|uniref:N-acetyltransferase domain-containing protein n=1 Tax=Diacronema lutheri TaxID=2081491 RepID=A0A8J5XAP4_DIALT|nr:hypothetical protein KFE25_014430 [Diacronema lutheri]